MKIQLPNSRQRTPNGSAVIVVLAFLAIMVLLVASNTKTINSLRAEVRLTDQRETKRLATSIGRPPAATVTNAVPGSNP